MGRTGALRGDVGGREGLRRCSVGGPYNERGGARSGCAGVANAGEDEGIGFVGPFECVGVASRSMFESLGSLLLHTPGASHKIWSIKVVLY